MNLIICTPFVGLLVIKAFNKNMAELSWWMQECRYVVSGKDGQLVFDLRNNKPHHNVLLVWLSNGKSEAVV